MQDSLFDEPRAHARRTDPLTSHAAAASVGKLRDSQDAVLRHLRAHGPMTDEELVEGYSRRSDVPQQSPSGIRTRRRELTDRGLVRDTGGKRKLVSGRNAIVWTATP